NLLEVYNIYDISWNAKVSIAFGICRGISYLNSCLILHHDIRCANIMMTPHLEPKITNFRYAIDKSKINTEYYEYVPNVDDIINWMAPEKILNYRYNEECEMFSQRENLNIKLNNDEKILQESYFKIIKNTWHHHPQERLNLQTVLFELDKLVSNYHQNGFSQSLIPKYINKLITESVDELEDKAKEWIEGAIRDRVIKSIGWSELQYHQKIGAGNFGTVFKAYWPNIHNNVVYKKLLISSDIQFKMWEAFKHELQIQSRAHSCENIIRVLGISKNLNNEYSIVMEYANEGDLSLYLSNNFEKLDWNKKIRLALDITNGLHYLHKENILHRDLVIIHHGRAKITDFGNSKSMNTMTRIHDHIFGNREKRMPNTPNEYYELYNTCWNDEPERRHIIEYVYE
ncbi:5176_t:CDS:2, partial [Funneliformis mosseae]